MTQPSLSIHREAGTTRSFTRWNTALLESAEILADSGNLRQAADLCEAMLGDGRVAGVLSTRVCGLLKLPLSFEGAGPKRQQARAMKALENDFWDMLPEGELAHLAEWGLLLGVGVGELIWEERPDHDGRYVPQLKIWHPRHLRWDWHTRTWRIATDDAGEIEVTPGDGKWILFCPYGSHRPWTRGLWRQCKVWWLQKQLSLQDWSRYSEVHGKPIPVGTTPVGADRDKRFDMAEEMSAWGNDAAIALPPGYDVKFLEATANTWRTFEAQIQEANTEIAIAITGQNLTTEVSGGSYAAASVHRVVRADLIAFDAKALSTTLRTQIITWWAEWNLADRTLAPWPAWDTEPPEDTMAVANGVIAMAKAIRDLESLGVPVDREAMLRRRNVPLLPNAETPKPPPPPPPVERAPEPAEPKQADPAPAPEPHEPEPAPTAPDTTTEGAQVVPKERLNGAQIDSALRMLDSVVQGKLPRGSAVGLLKHGLDYSSEEAEEIVDEVGNGFTPTPQSDPAAETA